MQGDARPRKRRVQPLVWWGLGGLVLGSGPLLGWLLLARIGVLSDPNPNPVGPGILAFLTFWPSIIVLGIGVMQTLSRRA